MGKGDNLPLDYSQRKEADVYSIHPRHPRRPTARDTRKAAMREPIHWCKICLRILSSVMRVIIIPTTIGRWRVWATMQRPRRKSTSRDSNRPRNDSNRRIQGNARIGTTAIPQRRHRARGIQIVANAEINRRINQHNIPRRRADDRQSYHRHKTHHRSHHNQQSHRARVSDSRKTNHVGGTRHVQHGRRCLEKIRRKRRRV